ncbi:MAG: arylamine N-acetyltransferase [Actinomycetia bacterium]|nr:arylamine N-acetyltransferase [Actinomycetes bacterium]
MSISRDAYLERIGLSVVPTVDVEGLETLQRAHLTAIPFENLDVYAGRDVRTDLDWSLHKIVERQRGGWCFELNGAFGELLRQIGFDVRRLSATVLLSSSSGPPSHLTLEVRLDVPYLVDVGFGDSFITPLRLESSEIQPSGDSSYMIENARGVHTLSEATSSGVMKQLYRFDRSHHELADYTIHSKRLQTDRTLKWSQARFATRLVDGGPDRVTLLEDVLKFRRDGVWTAEAIQPDDWDTELARWFTMTP